MDKSLMRLINDGESVSVELQRGLMTEQSIERWTKQLKNEELIEFLGASKTGGYFAK